VYDALTLEAIAGVHSAERVRRAEAMAAVAAAMPSAAAKPTADPGRYVRALLIAGVGYAAVDTLRQAL
jgi:hypothetical protein